MACPVCGLCNTGCKHACKCTKKEILDHRLKKTPMTLASGKVVHNSDELLKATEGLLKGKETGYRNSKGEFILTK